MSPGLFMDTMRNKLYHINHDDDDVKQHALDHIYVTGIKPWAPGKFDAISHSYEWCQFFQLLCYVCCQVLTDSAPQITSCHKVYEWSNQYIMSNAIFFFKEKNVSRRLWLFHFCVQKTTAPQQSCLRLIFCLTMGHAIWLPLLELLSWYPVIRNS